mgnify:CR=1 FL=1
MLRGIRAIDDVNESPKKDVHNLSIEKIATMYISTQETIINLQSKIHACKEGELNLQHGMEIQNITMKEELHAMKNWMLELRKKMINLEVKKEMLMKANVEMKSTLEAKEDVIMTKLSVGFLF